ncbi:MAG: lysophospholipid acyltransferase family protein [Anaerolineae bacterium]
MTESAPARERAAGDSVADALPPTHPLAYRLAFWFMHLVYDRYLTTRIIGREHLPPPGIGAIMAISHNSALDYVAGFAYGHPGYVAIKREAAYRPLRWIGGIPINRDKQDMVALRAMRAVLAAGYVLGIAPEGTRSRDGRLLPFDPGFVWLALKADVPVIPCAIHGAHRLLPPGRLVPRRGPLWLKIGAPLRWPDAGPRPSREAMQAMADETRRVILGLLADLEAESGIESPALAWERAAGTALPPAPR